MRRETVSKMNKTAGGNFRRRFCLSIQMDAMLCEWFPVFRHQRAISCVRLSEWSTGISPQKRFSLMR